MCVLVFLLRLAVRWWYFLGNVFWRTLDSVKINLNVSVHTLFVNWEVLLVPPAIALGYEVVFFIKALTKLIVSSIKLKM